MGYQTAPHGNMGLPFGLYQFMSLTEGTTLLFESDVLATIVVANVPLCLL